jgi:hypothetical protein
MLNRLSVAMTRLSTRIIIGCVLVLSAADVAAAQTLTANGTTGALSIDRGDTVTIATSGSATNWVGLFPVGAGNSNFLQYFYLNGAVLITFQTQSLLAGAYEFRELTNPQPRTVVATSGVVTVPSAGARRNDLRHRAHQRRARR